MKKLSFITLVSMLVFAIFLVGCEENILTGQVVYEQQAQELVVEETEPVQETTEEVVLIIEDSEGSEESGIVPGFGGLRAFLQGSQAIIDGEFYDLSSGTGLDANVVIMCDGLELSDIEQTQNGLFSLIAYKTCAPGSEAWIIADYEGKEYESKHIMIPRRIFGSYGSGYKEDSSPSLTSMSMGGSSEPAGVPEFSTITLGMAIIGGCLGLAFLRKH